MLLYYINNIPIGVYRDTNKILYTYYKKSKGQIVFMDYKEVIMGIIVVALVFIFFVWML